MVENVPFLINFTRETSGRWDVSFMVEPTFAAQNGIQDEYGNTGRHGSASVTVFSTVLAEIRSLVTTVKPKGLTCTAFKGHGKQSLYARLVKSKFSDFDVVTQDDGPYVKFVLTKPRPQIKRPTFTAAENPPSA
jgi:hypothetical protein